jgi:hypothetical protein
MDVHHILPKVRYQSPEAMTNIFLFILHTRPPPDFIYDIRRMKYFIRLKLARNMNRFKFRVNYET